LLRKYGLDTVADHWVFRDGSRWPRSAEKNALGLWTENRFWRL